MAGATEGAAEKHGALIGTERWSASTTRSGRHARARAGAKALNILASLLFYAYRHLIMERAG
jgi:hypothetical protein